MRALDLYAGIGGWTLGLSLAGVKVVQSFERWPIAVETYNANLGAAAEPVDIRNLKLKGLPEKIDLIVGSPPCTEFSFSNRGGNGNFVEGLKDVVCFLEIVRHVQPKYWVMENVPRVANIIREGFATRGNPLYKFRDLNPDIEILNFSDFGLPQNRIRCFVGNIPFKLLNSYKSRSKRRTLGDVVSSLNRPRKVTDSIWGVALSRSQVTEMEIEGALDSEQLRMNKAAKIYHPVYNNMAFPDNLGEPSRTVTATCTRVSRESIVVPNPDDGMGFRRLTVRERACLQGFPITYQFFSKSYSDKMKLIGNALPPPIAYLIASAVQQVAPSGLRHFKNASNTLSLPVRAAPVTQPNERGLSYPSNRPFKAAIPNLRFKSGMRFELVNQHKKGKPCWSVSFYFGPSKAIQSIRLDAALLRRLYRYEFIRRNLAEIKAVLKKVDFLLVPTNPTSLQDAWAHKLVGTGPFEIIDALGVLSVLLSSIVRTDTEAAGNCLLNIVGFSKDDWNTTSTKKFRQHAASILSGLMLGAYFNGHRWHKVGVSRIPSKNTKPALSPNKAHLVIANLAA